MLMQIMLPAKSKPMACCQGTYHKKMDVQYFNTLVVIHCHGSSKIKWVLFKWK